MKLFWKQYIITGLLITIGGIFIHQKFTFPPNWASFFMWIPLAWFLTLIFAFVFNSILNYGEKD